MATNRLAETLLLLRHRAGYSQEYVADTLGVHYTTYGAYERDASKLKAEQAQRIAALYQLSIEHLYNFDAMAIYEPARSGGRGNQPAPPPRPESPAPTLPPVNTRRLLVSIELDGTDQVLNEWITQLKAMNRLLRKK